MKQWVERYRSVRKRTVRSETTKDKAGALPPSTYATNQPAIVKAISDVLPANDQDEIQQFPSAENEQINSGIISRHLPMGISFVDEAAIVKIERFPTSKRLNTRATSFQ